MTRRASARGSDESIVTFMAVHLSKSAGLEEFRRPEIGGTISLSAACFHLPALRDRSASREEVHSMHIGWRRCLVVPGDTGAHWISPTIWIGRDSNSISVGPWCMC